MRMLTYYATSTGTTESAWQLSARPARWHEWAPHIRGAWGLGEPYVEEGRIGFVRLLGALPVAATITRVIPGKLWSWRVGPVTLHHRVEPHAHGSVVGVEIDAPAPLEATLKATYGPLVNVLTKRLASKAATTSRP